jgi:hypothetical protein
VHQPVVVPTTVLCCLHRRDDRRVSRKAFRLNGCGVGVTAARVSAPACGSIKRGRWVAWLWVPIVPIGRYRMIYTRAGLFSSEYYSRHLSPPGRWWDARLGLALGVLGLVGAVRLLIGLIEGVPDMPVAGVLLG